jgi:hypothetical protein
MVEIKQFWILDFRLGGAGREKMGENRAISLVIQNPKSKIGIAELVHTEKMHSNCSVA